MPRRDRKDLFSLDVQLPNDSNVLVILLAKMTREIRARWSDRIELQGDELRIDIGRLHCRGEPTGKPRNRFRWRVRRCDQAEPDLCLIVLITGLGDSGHVWQRVDAAP